ncbi:Addiction module antidote protein, HigA [Candidatus Magnetomorum sp. HK-1]|nr:Addiction module antidote protein, HigA [Candidatus Magnetomorum sp. HK-1]
MTKTSSPPQPGAVLKNLYMKPSDLTTANLAKQLNVSPKKISDIIHNRARITLDLAVKLSSVFSPKPDFWLNIQTNYDLWNATDGNRGTDDPFYTFMQISGDAILKLIGVDNTQNYESISIVLKEKKLYPDIVAFPKKGKGERIFIEFQGNVDKMIRFSLASKITMSCAHDHYNGPVLGVIIYTDKNCKDNALPVQLNSTFDQTCNLCATFKEIVLPSYSEKQFSKIDQRLTILAPFTISPNVSSKKLKQLCYQWKKTLFNAYPETMYKDIVNVLSLFILNRFRDLSVKEVKEMLNFDLSSTRAGIELIGIGEKKGQKKWQKEGQKEGQRNFLIMALKDRFGKLSKQIEIEIRQSNFNTLVKLRKSLFNFSSIDDVYQWWEQYGKPIKKK